MNRDFPKRALDILVSMQAAGQAVVAGTATPDSVGAHIDRLLSFGYNRDAHEDFEKFLMQDVGLLPVVVSHRPRFKTGQRRIRLVGEILVDWAVLEAARTVAGRRAVRLVGRTPGQWRAALPFVPPPFDMEAEPYTPIAHILGRFGGAHALAATGDYDDIFNQILLWRIYYKEPFHGRYYGQAKTMDDYRRLRIAECERMAEEARQKQQSAAKRARNNAWADNTSRDLSDKCGRAKAVEELEAMLPDERLTAIARSPYLLDYYQPRSTRKEWGRVLAESGAVSSLDDESREALSLKLEGRNYHGWGDVKRQLAEAA